MFSTRVFIPVSFIILACADLAAAWGSSEKVRLRDVDVLTLYEGRMTNGRRSSPVPQLACVGGSAGCSGSRPRVVQCYNRGHDGYDIQWECKADMESQYRFGEIAVNCEGFDHPDDPYVLKGSCGLEYTVDRVGGNHDHHQSGYRDNNNYNHQRHHRGSSSTIGTIITWCVIAAVVYYIYTTFTGNRSRASSSQYPTGQASAPPPPGFRPEYTSGDHTTHTNQGSGSWFGRGNFWSGAATGGLLGYLFGNSGGYNRGYGSGYGSRYGSGYGYGGHRNGGWWGSNNSQSSGWFSGGSGGRASSGWSAPTQGTSRTASGFGGTKRR